MVEVLLAGDWLPAEGSVLPEDGPGLERGPRGVRKPVPEGDGARGDPLVVLTLGRDQGPALQGPAAVGTTGRSSLA